MKLCKDCRHLILNGSFIHTERTFWMKKIQVVQKEAIIHGRCALTEMIEPALGAKEYHHVAVMRGRLSDCGPEGKLFEAKDAPQADK